MPRKRKAKQAQQVGRPLPAEVKIDYIKSNLFRTVHADAVTTPAIPSPALDDVFRDLATRWREQTSMLSSVADIAAHPAYQSIVGMGADAVPLILNDLAENGPDHWFWALTAITRENPVTAEIAGDLQRMTEAWLEWGKQKGYPIVSATRSSHTSQI